MFAKLTAFRQGMENGQTAGDWKECLRFTKNERTRTVALHKIHGANKNLERLLRGSGMLIKSEQQPPPKRSTPPTRTRRFSSALYDTMAGKWPNTCECHRRHEARLCLWNCCSSQRLSESDDSLDMLVSIKDRDQGLASWQESTLLVSSERYVSAFLLVHYNFDFRRVGLTKHFSGSDPRNAQRAIRFVVDGKAVPIPSTENNPGRDIDSESLCKLIKESHHRGNSLRLIYKYGKLWQARSRRKSLRIQKQIDVPLKILLPTRGMRLKDQRILAVVLAHAALHCSDGPWLCKDWSKEHITFFRHDATGIDLSRPCLAVNFTDPPFFTGDDPNPFNPHAYPSLLSLGILLLEIYLCQPIESRWSELDLIDGQPNENTNLTTAMRLLEDSEGDLYEDYRNAIKACLNCDRIWANDDSPDPEEFRRQVYEDIVYPLEQELERGFHVKPEDLHLDRESDDESPKN